MKSLAFALAVCALAACGDDGHTPIDARADMALDAPIDMHVDSGPCGVDRYVTGELVDIDSTEADFHGVFNARFTVQGAGGATDQTSPNGRFELCVPGTGNITMDLATVVDSGTSEAHLGGYAYIDGDIPGLNLVTPASFRSFTPSRAATFYTSLGLTYDSNKAQLLVYAAGDRTSVTIDRAHDTTQKGNDDVTAGTFVWSAGDTGRFVLFPNVDVGAATAVITGDIAGTHTVPVGAGKLTVAALAWFIL